MKTLINTATEINDIPSFGVGLKHVDVSGTLINHMKKEKICGIYLIISPSGAMYVGQSVDVMGRYRYYKAVLCKDQFRVYNSIKKYGWENHVFKIIHRCCVEELDNLEQYYIKHYDTFDTAHGMNLTSGGRGRGIVSQETKNRCSAALKGMKAWNKGIPRTAKEKDNISKALKNSEAHKTAVNRTEYKKKLAEKSRNRSWSEESRKKISEKLKNRVFSEISKKKMSLSHKGKIVTQETRQKISKATKGSNNPFYGKKHSPENIQKLITFATGRKPSPESVEKRASKLREKKRGPKFSKFLSERNSVKINQYTLDGAFIKIWNSIKEAADYYKIGISSLSEAVRENKKDGSKRVSVGFIWKYHE